MGGRRTEVHVVLGYALQAAIVARDLRGRAAHRGTLGGMYYVYILASIRRILYIGITNDLERRITEHRYGLHPDSFASRYRCNRLVHVEEFTRVRDAIDREKELKGWRRDKKIHLIQRTNPDWNDLAPPLPPGPSLRSG